MTTENEGLYTNIETEKTAAGQDGQDGANAANQNMDTLPLGEGVRTVEEADSHEENTRWNDGNLPREADREEVREDER
ncbi:hypothetical protein [Corynebacterium sp. MSK008]|uniref:hypothetical protein n=1 Tax=Corynebacterium sp. MSK008 TaxID=3050188 RepID=UPI00254A19AB|nr:hypothetical protein [Corynebacterium sp. MSK008]MDK8879728.1 hypothetical protein [Corynebacterium sp. MSK008]